MPSEAEHLTKAVHNEMFCAYLDSIVMNGETYYEWEAVGLFYSALHYVDAYLARMPYHPRNHLSRNNLIGMITSLRPIYDNYLTLYDRSMDARYEYSPFSKELITELRRGDFASVKAHVTSLLNA